MANSELQGRNYSVSKSLLGILQNVKNHYKGDKQSGGYKRLNGILDNGEISYEQLKRIKNYFDYYNGDGSDDEYILNGGKDMEQWVEDTLKDARQNIKGKKKAMSDIGMQNQYIKTHTKDGFSHDTEISDVSETKQIIKDILSEYKNQNYGT